MYSMKRIGERGDTWGELHLMFLDLVTVSSRRTRACLSSIKEPTNLTKFLGQPCCSMRIMSRLRRTASKAPCTSSIIIVVVCLFSNECPMSCVTQARRSVAERAGIAPACCGLITLKARAVEATRLASILSRPLPRQERSAMGLQERVDVKSFLLGLR